jgi:hypothetical protein
MARRKIQAISREEIIDAIQAADRSIGLAAKALQVSQVSLYKRILSDYQLLAFLAPERALENMDGEERQPAIVPDPCPLDVTDIDLPDDARDVGRNDVQLLVSGLRNAGIKAGTMEKLDAMGAFSPATGQIIGHSLRTMHQMLVYGNVALFEEAESVREEFLGSNSTLSDAEKAEWYQIFISIWNTLGKGYDRTMKGTVALVEMSKAQGANDDDEVTPGFKPLK